MDGARAGVLFAVPREARAVGAEWDRLAEASVSPPAFGPELIKELPEPARRWLAHVIAPGTPLWRTAVVTMRGQIRLGAWRSFTAHQVVTVPEGYIWAATVVFRAGWWWGTDRQESGEFFRARITEAAFR